MNEANDALFPVRLEGLRFASDDRVLIDDVSTEIGHTPLSVLLGPNGAGKTLLMRLCRGLLQPTRGSVRWGRYGVEQLGVRVGYVPQHPVMLRRSVRANVAYALALAGVAHRQRGGRIRDVLTTVGLTHLERAGARHLSGGERQRLAIARAWAQRPAALMLDEPAAHLDPAAAASIEHVIRTIRDSGTRIILCTHDMNQAHRLADEVVFMNGGRVVEQSAGERFFDGPGTDCAARFINGELLA